MAYEVGCDLSLRNVQNLTPLTLAAKLAKIEMFFHILNIEREIYWQIGSITCAAYPLSQIDTIDNETGNINKDSALNLVVFGDRDEHLELMDGVLVDLLHAKWNAFVKSRFYRQFFLFFLYFLVSIVCFTQRPGPAPVDTSGSNTTSPPIIIQSIRKHHHNNTRYLDPGNVHLLATPQQPMHPLFQPFNASGYTSPYIDFTSPYINDTTEGTTTTTEKPTVQQFRPNNIVVMSKKRPKWLERLEECRLLQINSGQDFVRIICEITLEIGACLYIIAALREARFLGLKMFIENLSTAPSRVMFLIQCLLMISFPILRFKCDDKLEDIVSVIIMLTTAPYFLFFCRGFQTFGPFVVMIYRMIQGDLLRFACIYLVFILGFSQAYYIIFLSYDNPNTPDEVDDSMSNPVPNPVEAVMAMFFMSLTNFGDYYTSFEKTDHENTAKILFVVFMSIVAILLINLLIAMMGNTYQKIAETKNEWQRQWARIVLVVERGVPPHERLTKLMWYSQPMSDGRRALVLRLNQSEEDKTDMREILEMKRVHNRMVQKRLEGKKVILSAPPTPEKSI